MQSFFFLGSCTTCQRIINDLKLPDTIERVDIKEVPLTKTQLNAMHALSGSYEALFSKRAQLYKQRNLKEQSLTENDFQTLILEHYTFLKRPVLIYDSNIFIGNSAKVVAAAKDFLNAQ